MSRIIRHLRAAAEAAGLAVVALAAAAAIWAGPTAGADYLRPTSSATTQAVAAPWTPQNDPWAGLGPAAGDEAPCGLCGCPMALDGEALTIWCPSGCP